MTEAGRDWRAYSVEGVFLRILVHENRRIGRKPVYEWLLQEAKRLGIHGGSAYRGIAGFGRHGVLHEAHFFELAGDLPVEIRFVCSEADANRLLDAVQAAGQSLFYVIGPTRYGFTGADKSEWTRMMQAPG
jgi:PII-like signaling protein